MSEDTQKRIATDQDLQEERIAFERDKVAYEQNAQHLRSLNQFLWQVPTIAISLTGGLWYGVAKLDAEFVRLGLLLFAGTSNLLLVLVLARVRHLFGEYLEVQATFNPKFNIKNETGPQIGLVRLPTKTVVWCFVTLLIAGAIGSFVGAANMKLLGGGDAKPSAKCLAE